MRHGSLDVAKGYICQWFDVSEEMEVPNLLIILGGGAGLSLHVIQPHHDFW